MRTYPAYFRTTEISKLATVITAGDSASIIGVSGMGKSNLFNHLLHPETQQRIFGDAWQNYLVVRINFHYIVDSKLRSIFSLILDQLELLIHRAPEGQFSAETAQSLHNYHNALIDSAEDALKVQRNFTLAIRTIMQDDDRKLVFLFDQFEAVFQQASGGLFLNLRGLREAYKDRVSFITFTRDTLPQLAEMDADREEFYELVAPNLLGLGPYAEADSHDMLNGLARKRQSTIDDASAEKIIELSGGHGGLIKAIYLAYAQDNAELEVDSLIYHENIQAECGKIWQSISLEEKRVSQCIAQKFPLTPTQSAEFNTLAKKRIIINETDLFTPLFTRFVRQCADEDQAPLEFDQATKRIYVLGNPTEKLTSTELRLFTFMHENVGYTVTYTDLKAAGWPDHPTEVSNNSVHVNIRRLRHKIEPDPTMPRFIENDRPGNGYRLNDQ